MVPSSSEPTGPGTDHHLPRGVTAMPVRLNCPGCQAAYTFPDHMAGQRVRCKQCRSVFFVGQPRPAEEPLDAILEDESSSEVQSRPARVPPPPPRSRTAPPGSRSKGNAKAPPSRPAPEKKGSAAPLIIGGVLIVLLLLCGLPVLAVGGLMLYYASDGGPPHGTTKQAAADPVI